jgi:hypothetical protein
MNSVLRSVAARSPGRGIRGWERKNNVIKKFSEAFSLLRHHIGLFAAIVLTVWLPGNALVNIVAMKYGDASDLHVLRLTTLIEAVFGPLYIGALVYALAQIKMGRAITYKEAMNVGVQKWGALFLARLVAGILVAIGLFAFVIPGIVLALRYAFLEQAVVLENKETTEARARSTVLTAGRKWRILAAAVLFFIAFMIFSYLTLLPLDFIESTSLLIPVSIAVDCLQDVVYMVIQIVIFLFYWEALERETSAKPSPADEATMAT